MKTKTFLKGLLAACFAAAACCALFLYDRYFDTEYTPSDYTESADDLSNPYQGLYGIYAYVLTESDSLDHDTLQWVASGGTDMPLALLEINLRNYLDGPVGNIGLSQLDEILSSWSASGKQLIVRFLYDWDGRGAELEPDSLDIVLEHMTQTASVLNPYSRSIHILQGIFVGSYGEMHHSNYMSEQDMLTLINHLDSVTDESIYLSVRTPRHWRAITGRDDPFPESEAFSGSLPSRLSLFNDGMLGSSTDTGTYESGGARGAELRFQDKLCRFVPNGGEVILDNPYNDFPECLSDLSAMHVSYLNSQYDPSVLDKWKQSLYTGNDVFSGMNGYDYICRHLGYRYVLRSSEVSFRSFRDKTAQLSFAVENVGFGNSCRPFTLKVLVQDTENQELISIPVDTDSRFLYSGDTLTLSVPLDIRSYGTGIYRIYLQLTDDSTGTQIQFANTLPCTANGYELGSLEVTK